VTLVDSKGSKTMSLAGKHEDGLELVDPGYTRLLQPPQSDDTSSDSLLSANQLARYGHPVSHLASADLAGDQSLRLGAPPNRRASRGDGDSGSQHHNNSHSYDPVHAGPSTARRHVSAKTNNLNTLKDPKGNAVDGPGKIVAVASQTKRSNQRDRLPQSQVNEAPSYILAKAKAACSISSDSQITTRRSSITTVDRWGYINLHPPTVLEEGEFDLGQNGIPSLSEDHIAITFRNDLEFERRRYCEKKQQRLRTNAGYFCTAVKSKNCRVHRRPFREASAVTQHQDSSRIDTSQSAKHGFVDKKLRPDESTALCGTVYEQADLAEEAGVAAEWRRRDENTLRCIDGWWVIVVVLLGLAALVGFLVENA
jgi:hypothetical protein